MLTLQQLSQRSSYSLGLVVSIGLSQRLPAQRVTDALIGSRVRLEITSGAQVIGTIVALESDTIRVASRNAAVAVPRNSVMSYDVSLGRERGRGARRGALAGGALGFAVVVASLGRDTATVNRQPSDLRAAVPIGIGLLALGAAIGSALAPEQWDAARSVASAFRVRAGTCPEPCVAVRYRF